MTNPTDLRRIEVKVDTLTEAVNKLVLFEERQAVQAALLTVLTDRTTQVEQKLDMWINRGIGVWAVVSTAVIFYKTLGGH